MDFFVLYIPRIFPSVFRIAEQYGLTIPPDDQGATVFNPLNAELNPICHQPALFGAHHIFHFSGLRVKIRKEIIRIIEKLDLRWYLHTVHA